VLEEFGADALRLYLINSPVVRAEPLKFQRDVVHGVIRDVFLPLCNALKFFVQNANAWARRGGPDRTLTLTPATRSANDVDIWILAATQTLISNVHEEMRSYKLRSAAARAAVPRAADELVRAHEPAVRHALAKEDVKVTHSFPEGIVDYETTTDGDVLAWFVARVTQLRKSAGLAISATVESAVSV